MRVRHLHQRQSIQQNSYGVHCVRSFITLILLPDEIPNIFLAQGYFRPKTLPNSAVETLLNLYPTDLRLGCPYNTGNVKLTSGTLDKQACSIFGDIVQVGPARMIAQQIAKHNGNVPVYRYRFDQLPHNTSSLAKGITTGLEQSYVFSNLVADFPWDQALAREITSAWVSFAYSLDPNPGSGTTSSSKPKYENETDISQIQCCLTGPSISTEHKVLCSMHTARLLKRTIIERKGLIILSRMYCRTGHSSSGHENVSHQ